MRVELAVPIPKTFGGRPVSNFGIHMAPNGQWGAFMENPDEWIQRLLDMHMSWVMCLTDSDSFVKQGAAKTLLDAGIIPLVRFNPSRLPRQFTQMVATEELVELYAQYNVPCIIQWLNEPGNSREWVNKEVPDNWWEIWTANWRNAARLITERGAICAIPDGPCYEQSPFPYLLPGLESEFEEGWIAYAGHYYALNRPVNWPYDNAQRFGTQMTPAEYEASLDDFVDIPDWRDPPLEVLNAERTRLKNPDLTPIQDDTCWLGWQKVEARMGRDLGFKIPHFQGEGGVTPKARAGSGENNELRYTLPTPKKVAERTLLMYDWTSPMFAICPWILASEHLGATGWYDACWFGGAYYELYGFAKPVVDMLKNNPPIVEENDWAVVREYWGKVLDIAVNHCENHL